MAYQGTSKIVVQIAITCEACGNPYAYERTLTGTAQAGNQLAAMSAAQESLGKQIEQIQSGNHKSIAAHRPCPQCGYVQSWMVEPVRRRRGWQWGLGMAFASYLFAFLPLFLLVNRDFPGSDCVTIFVFFGAPVIVFFVVRALVLKLYQPNRGREVPAQTNAPNITFRHP